MTSGLIPGLYLVKHTSFVNREDNPDMPYKLEIWMRPGLQNVLRLNFMFRDQKTTEEEIVIRGETLEAIHEYLKRNARNISGRFNRALITGPGTDRSIENADELREYLNSLT